MRLGMHRFCGDTTRHDKHVIFVQNQNLAGVSYICLGWET